MGTRARLHGLIAIALGLAACGFPAASPDGDTPPGVGFQFPTSLTDEAVVTHAVSIALSEPATEIVTVDVEITGGTADENTDFSLVMSNITFPVGMDRADVELSIVNDGLEEENETIELRLTNPSHAQVVHDSHTVTISRNILPRIQFAATSSMNMENAGDQSFEVMMNEVSPIDVVVAYAVTGTAIGSSTMTDHGLVDGQLTITAGQLSVMLPAPITNDPYDEFDETVDLTLSAQIGAVLGVNTAHSHTIQDDDPEPNLVFDSATSNELENLGPTQTQIHINLVPESGKNVTVDCGLMGATALATEYGIGGCGTGISFPAGTTQQIVAFTPFDDALYENAETVTIELKNPTNAGVGGTSVHTWSITNDDAVPTIQFAAPTSTPAEAVGSYNVSVTQSAVSGLDTTFNITTTNGTASGGDYTVSSGPYTIPAGMTSVNVPVTITADNSDEPDETFSLGFSNVNNATASGQTTHGVTIIDDDVKISFDPTESDVTADEGNGSGSTDFLYEVILDTASTLTVTVNFTATGTAGSGGSTTDRTVLPNSPLRLTFAPGETSKFITVRVNHDNTSESDETVILTLDPAPTNAERVSPFIRTHTIHSEE